VPHSGNICMPQIALPVIVSVPVCFVAALEVNVTEIEEKEPVAKLAVQLLIP
jgi:hypothetical protein